MIRVYKNGWKHTIGIVITIQNGSFFETTKTEGFTHIAEHLMFSGTKSLNRYELREKHETIFTNLEARTSKEEVNIYCEVDIKDANEAIGILHEMIFDWKCRQDVFTDEKKDLFQETKSYFSSPEDMLRKKMYALLPFEEMEILGNPSKLQKMKYGDIHKIKKYWNTLLAKSTIDLLFVGNNIPKELIRKTGSLFSRHARHKDSKQTWKRKGVDLIETKDSHSLQIQHNIRHPYLLFLGQIYQYRLYTHHANFSYLPTQFKHLTCFFVTGLKKQDALNFFFQPISKKEFSETKRVFLQRFRKALDGTEANDSLAWIQGFRFGTYGDLISENPELVYKQYEQMSYSDFTAFVEKNVFPPK